MGGVTFIPGTSIRSEWRLVTAGEMAEMLERNIENRPLDEKHVARLEKDFRAGHFEKTHQGIAFDVEGMMRDGQHRGTAQVRAGVDMWWLITEGLDPATQRRMDSGKKRQVSHFMQGHHTALRAAAHRLVVATKTVGPVVTVGELHTELAGLTAAEIEEKIPAKIADRLESFASRASKAALNVRTMGPSPLLAAAVLVLDDDDAGEFLDGLASMTGLSDGDPRLALIKMNGRAGQRVQQSSAMVMALKAAIAFREGDEIRRLKPGIQRVVELPPATDDDNS